jgi:hypothetical protein
MGGGKGGSGSGEVRFAPYLESAHKDFLTGNSGRNLKEAFNTAWGNSPYADREDILPDSGYLGVGYKIENFPSLFDMYGKFMAGLDVEILWTQLYYSTVQGPEANDLIAEFSKQTEDEARERSYPALHAGMRDIGAINSSMMVVGRSLIESRRMKEITKFSVQTKMQLLQMSQERWARHLDWNRNVIATYNDMMRIYYVAAMDADQINYKYKEADASWNLSLFEYVRAMLGAMTGAAATQKGKEPSGVQKALGGAMSGAASGAMVGSVIPGVGTAIGAVVGGVLGLASGFL